MTFANLVCWTSMACLLCGLTGCRAQADRELDKAPAAAPTQSDVSATTNTDQREEENGQVTHRKLIISKTDDTGVSVRLGELQFDEANQPTLSTDASGAAADQLTRDWEELRGRGELIWKTSVPDTVEGEEVTRIVGQKVRLGDKDYIYAVMNTLERSYGYEVDLVE
jgi:hypothetical protein